MPKVTASQIAAFSGQLSKDQAGAEQVWADGVTVRLAINLPPQSWLIPMSSVAPGTPNNLVKPEIVFKFSDGSSQLVSNVGAGDLVDTPGSLANLLMGGAGGNGVNNGKMVTQIVFQVNNTTGAPQNVNIANSWRIRGYVVPIGGGGVP